MREFPMQPFVEVDNEASDCLSLHLVICYCITGFQGMTQEGDRLEWIVMTMQQFPQLKLIILGEGRSKHGDNQLSLYKSVAGRKDVLVVL